MYGSCRKRGLKRKLEPQKKALRMTEIPTLIRGEDGGSMGRLMAYTQIIHSFMIIYS